MDNRFFRVTYEIPPMRAIMTAEFEEMAAGTSVIEEIVKQENPLWRILKIERGLKR